MSDTLPVVDAVFTFGGGLYPDTGTPNHLSLMRLMSLKSYFKYKEVANKPFIIVSGANENYHTGVVRSEPSAAAYARFLDEGIIDPKLLIVTNNGFCTITEVLGAKSTIEEKGFRTIMYNTSQTHEPRVLKILQHVLGDGYTFIPNPYAFPDTLFMNIPREEQLLVLFMKHFGGYAPGQIPYTDDKTFYEIHRDYYDESRSILEKTQQGEESFDRMAYLTGREKK